jgi:hypothetical protein
MTTRRCEPLVVKYCKKKKGIGIALDCYHADRTYELHVNTTTGGTVVTPAPQLHPTGKMMYKCNWKNLVTVKVFGTGTDLPPDDIDAFQEQWCYHESEMADLEFVHVPTPESSSYWDSDEDGSDDYSYSEEYTGSEYTYDDDSASEENVPSAKIPSSKISSAKKNFAPVGPSI